MTKLVPADRRATRRLAWMFAIVAVMIYTQLALGAGMRHAHAGLSIRDFPTAYGQWWPVTDAATLARINQERTGSLGMPATSATQILLQMFHRVGAGLVGVGVLAAALAVWNNRRLLPTGLLALTMLGPVLITVQISLGIYTIWTNKAADIATLHVATGAASLVWSVLTTAGLLRCGRSVQTVAPTSFEPIEEKRELALAGAGS